LKFLRIGIKTDKNQKCCENSLFHAVILSEIESTDLPGTIYCDLDLIQFFNGITPEHTDFKLHFTGKLRKRRRSIYLLLLFSTYIDKFY
jgi:hypothetical protein